jgi:hypothetical protein
LKLDQLPARWRAEFEAMAAKDPAIVKRDLAPGRFALGKVIAAFQRALAELGRGDIRVMTGSWGFDWNLSADTFYPKDVALLPLDYAVLHGESQLDTADRRAVVRRIADGGRRIIPITWAHHDDGAYVGRPFTPYEDFHAKLADMGCPSFGIIHWTTRPLDLYFKSLVDQVWKATENRPLKASCEAMAARCFGPAARGQGGEYLYAWVTGAPIFGRETSDTFIDRPFTPETVTQAVAGCRARLALLDRIDPAPLDPASRDRVNYFRGLEEFCIACLEAEGLYQAACADIKRGDFNSRRAEVGACPVEKIIEQYARFSRLGGISRGEQGMVVALGLNWLPFFDGLRQAMALEPVRMKFGPTSHKDLAQGAGSLTFFMDAEKHLWRCYGEKETRAAEVVLPEGAPLEPAGGLPAAWAEVGRSGIAIDRPLTLHVRPFMHDVQVRGRTSTMLRPGSYRLHVILATAESDARRAVEVKVSGGAAAAPAGGFDRYTFEPVLAKFLRIVGHGNSANAWNSLYEARIPTLDATARQGAATASAGAKGCVAALAVDGRIDTRWAADGDGAWIQFALTGDAPVDHIDIAWYEAGNRTYKFDLLASADGQTWTKVAAKAEAAPAPAAPGPGVPRTDRPAPAGGVWRIVESAVPATIGAAGTVDVTLTPVSGKALLCGVVLEPLEASEPDAGASGHGPLP